MRKTSQTGIFLPASAKPANSIQVSMFEEFDLPVAAFRVLVFFLVASTVT